MKLFQKSDINAFWALFADNLANMVIISGVCKFVFKMPDHVVFGRILPGIGVALIVGLSFYAFLGLRLSKKEKRTDVTALPYGISTPIMFIYLFGIIGPVFWRTNDPVAAWQIGIAAAFIGGIIEASGSVIGPWLKKITPRAGMLGTLGGIAIVWIATVPMSIIFESPIIGFASLIIIFAGLIAGVRLPFRMPAGLLAIAAGTGIGLLTHKSSISFEGTGFYPPVPIISDMIQGLRLLLKNPQLFTIIVPIEIYNFIETMNNVESAEAAGDKYNVRSCQIMDGLGTMIGSVFGSPFPTTVYIGHPAYKRLGAGIGYAWGVGAFFFFGSMFGLVAFLHHFIPEAAVAPILVFIGIIILSQAFRATASKYAMAVGMAIIPHISDIIIKKVTGAVQEVSKFLSSMCPYDVQNPDKISECVERFKSLNFENMVPLWKSGQGFHYLGQSALSQGAIITGLIWGAMTAYLLDFKLIPAGFFALGAAVLTMLGLIHAPKIMIGFSPLFWGYIIIAVMLFSAHILKVKKDPQIDQFKYIEE
ncbi:MAG: xanthine/uracil/vitamin C permease [Spirochaetes bacterium]|nr:xanthine/uracil/vitamin C permease [Spirochaetota bacterium]